ncbi:MAG: hypothetical protein KIS94_03200 [Chitinophagales bacterium]|nr:hypothetical protein [Chitinophagales bacterium]
MQSRFTALGITNDDRAVLLAYELKEDEFKVDLHIVPRKSLSNEQAEKLEKEWTEGKTFDFPEDTLFVNPNLNAESILPADIRSDETGKIRIKQNEWAYTLLTAKLWESYLLELEELKKKAETLTQYDRQLFDDAKSFWERVLEHRKERDISQEGLDKIKDDVNSVFEKLKTFRKTESAEFEAASAKLRDEVLAKLEDIRQRADSKANFKELLEEFKTVQLESRKNRYTKSDDQTVRKNLDSTFQFINEQRNAFFSDKTAARIKGLQEVIQKMEYSLNRDKKDLEYYAKKADSSNIKSLELQLIKVKTNLLNETIASKEEKLKDIYATLEKLQKQASRQEHKTEETKAEVTDTPVTGSDAAPEQPASSEEPTSSASE